MANRGANRTKKRGLDGLRARAFAKFGFVAPLKTSVLLTRGVGAASFTRATVATVTDFEGCCRNVLSGEVRFQGQRRVRNLISTSSEDLTSWVASGTGSKTATTITFTQSDYYIRQSVLGTVNGRKLRVSFDAWGSAVPVRFELVDVADGSDIAALIPTLTATRTRYTFLADYSASSTIASLVFAINRTLTVTAGSVINFTNLLVEDVTGQSNQNPSEYVSVGANKLNYLLNTENLSAWTASGTPVPTSAGLLGNSAAWSLTDDSAAAYEYVTQSVTVPNDNSVWYLRFRLAKTSGGTAPVPGVNFGISGGSAVTANVRVHPDTGVVVGGSPLYALVDRGDYWEITARVTNNSSGNTSLGVQVYPAAMPNAGPYTDGVANTGTNTFAAFEVTKDVAPSTYFPVGNVYPFHGACVDGVKYFDTTNPNRVSGNVVYSDVPTEPCEGYAVAHIQSVGAGCISTPNSAANDITGNEIDIRVLACLDDWTPSGSVRFVCKGSATRSYDFYLIAGGTPAFYYSADGTQRTATTIPSIADKTRKWLRLTRSGATHRFYTSDDYNPVTKTGTWTKIGDDVAGTGAAATSTSEDLVVGAYGNKSTAYLDGQLLCVQIFDTVDGTQPRVDFNPREGCTENLLLQSQDFSTTWATSSAAVSANSTVAPDGTTTADTATASSNLNGSVSQTVTLGNSIRYRYSICAKAGTSSRSAFGLFDIAGGDWPGLLYVTWGADGAPSTQSTSGTVNDVAYEPVGNGFWWVSFTTTSDATNTSHSCRIYPDTVAGTGSVIVWRAQLRRLTIGGQRTTSQYLTTTTAAVRGWIDALGAQWTINASATVLQRQNEGVVIEGASTNLVLQSSNFGTTWTAVGTPTRTAAAAYCGDIALDLIGDDDGAGLERYSQVITFTADASKTVSFLVKQGSSASSVVQLYDTTAGVARGRVIIEWSFGVPSLTFSAGSQERAPEALGNGVYRIFMLAAGVVAANTNTLYVEPANTNAGAAAATGTIYIGGVQAENATTASSHIPTTTGTAARNADVLTYPLTGNLDSSGGTLFAEGSALTLGTADHYMMDVNDGTANERYGLAYFVGNSGGAAVVDGGAVQALPATGSVARGMPIKVAARVQDNDFIAAVNGALTAADAAGTMPTVTTIQVGATAAGGHFRGPERNLAASRAKLSNAELVAITR